LRDETFFRQMARAFPKNPRICLQTIKHFSKALADEASQNGDRAALAVLIRELDSQTNKLTLLNQEIQALRRLAACKETAASFANS